MTDAAVLAIRHGVAVTELRHVTCLKGANAAAFDALDVLCAGDLFVRDGQLVHALMLDDAAAPFADVYVACDGDVPIVLCEGPSVDAFREHAASHGVDASSFVNVSLTQDLISLDGPYAWEHLAAWLEPDVIGLPYLTFFHLDEGGICFRAGKTGEYGYVLSIPKDRSDATLARLMELGAELDVVKGDVSALDHCALENAFFSLRLGDLEGLTPLELQLQWRVSPSKRGFVGAEALAARRRADRRRRVTHFVSDQPLRVGDPVRYRSDTIGTVRAAARSCVRGDWIAQALVDVAYAHPGIDRYVVGEARTRTISAPFINNRSLYVDPRQHSYRYRDTDDFPPLVRKP